MPTLNLNQASKLYYGNVEAQKLYKGSQLLYPVPQIDPFLSDVILHLKGDDFTDNSQYAHTLTVSGSLAINTTIKKYGSGSIYIPPVTNLITLNSPNLTLGTTDWTIEYWAYRVSQTDNTGFLFFNNGSTTTNRISIEHYYNRERITIADKTYILLTDNPSLNTWVHKAFVKTGNTIKKYVGGILSESTTISTHNFNSSSWELLKTSSFCRITAYIDSIRITKSARYTANFNPETNTYLAY